MSTYFMDIHIDGSRVILGQKEEWIQLVDYYDGSKGGTVEVDIGILLARSDFAFARKTLGLESTDESKKSADRDALDYERSVDQLLHEMKARKTAEAVFKAIQSQNNYMAISPYIIRLGVDLNADATLSNSALYVSPNRNPNKHGFSRIRAGRSANSVIRFTPRQWGYRSGPLHANRPFLSISGPGFEPDETLLHEMVHGLRIMAGVGVSRWSIRHAPGQPSQGSMEEFYAMLITNIYRSECGDRLGLRKNYSNSSSETYTITNEEFLDTKRNRMHMRQLRRQLPQLFNDLNDIDAPFNPTQEFKDR